MDTIANMLTTLVNAQRVHKDRVSVPYSRTTERILNVLQDRRRIASLRFQEGTPGKFIVSLKYEDSGEGAIRGARRVSKPGGRRYVAKVGLPHPKHGEGFFIVSTSRGVMDGVAARKEGLGGELMCEIW